MADKKVIAFQVKVDTSEVTENVEKTTGSIDDLGKQTKKTSSEMKQGFKAAEQGTKGLGSSIGGLIKSLGIIGVAMAVFTFMKDMLMKNQKVMDALNVATTALEIIFMKLFEAVEPLGKVMSEAFEDPQEAVKELWAVIKENLINRAKGVVEFWKSITSVIKAAIDLDWDGVQEAAKGVGTAVIQVATGMDKAQQAAAAEGFKEFVKDVSAATVASVDQASALVALRNQVALMDADQRMLQLTYQKEAEIQRQIRDDISLTLEERQRANIKLGEVLEEQFLAEKKASDLRILLAEKELELNKGSIERQVELKNAKTELADLDERITGQRSEQLTNQKGLEKELFDIQQELRVATLDAREKELEELEIYYETLQEKARLAGETDVEIKAARLRALSELEDKFLKEDLAKSKAAANKKLAQEKKIANARASIATSLGSTLGSIAALVQQQGEKGVVAAKALAVAQIAIDTAKAIVGAIAQAQSVPYPGNLVAIATGVAAVVAGIASAVTTLNSTPGAGAPPPPSASAAIAGASAPSIQGVTTNTTELGNTEQAELAPIQAFVVETQLTGSQNEINQIEGQAEFGG